jgi:HEAT repeat protein
MKRVTKSAFMTLALFALSGLAAGQKPKVTNAQVQEISAASGLKAAVDSILQKQPAAAWIGYRIPVRAKDRSMCCSDGRDSYWSSGKDCCGGCRMESSSDGWSSGSWVNCSSPEPLPYAFIFLRAEGNQIGRIRVFSSECSLDFANLPLYWLEDIRPEQSVDLLAGLAVANGVNGEYESRKKRITQQAVMAIALHDTPAADQALEKLIQRGQPERVREDVVFWLGVERGRSGLELLRKYVKDDPDDRFRERGTFAFSQSFSHSKDTGATQDLIAMAHNDPSPRVRGQAIFWLAQIGGRKEAEQITAAIENDPETEVKKKAVFALSQMHDGEGVPLLINVAKTNKNPAVRKQAIFWLGQSHDPRALDYLEQLLTSK